MNKQPRSLAYYVVLWQALIVVFCALCFGLFDGFNAFYSAFFGGLASVVPSFTFAWFLFRTTSAQQAQRIVFALFVGEFAKLILSGVLLIIVLMLLPIKALPLLVGFIAAHLGFWIAPLTKKMNI